MEQPQPVKMLIIGSGPAGLAGALYAARANLEPVVLVGQEMGGQVSLTSTIENYPGFPQGITGQELTGIFIEQAERFGARLEFTRATKVDFSIRPFTVHTEDSIFTADSVLIATGASPRKIDIPGEKKFTGLGVSYCATCDGHFFREKKIAVVGGGDSAIEEGLFLTRFAQSVTVIHRRDTLRAGTLLQKRAFDNPKIKFIWDSLITAIEGKDFVRSIRLKNVKTAQETALDVDGVFIFIGHIPNTHLFAGQLTLDDNGYLVIDRDHRTNVPGIFAAGEVADPTYRQVITSAGAGAAAAIQAIRFLDEHTN